MEVTEPFFSAIGNTPMEEFKSLADVPGNIRIKLEYKNPGGSVKDRAALQMLNAAEKRGDIKKGETIVEASSGNTAIGLAQMAQERGYGCVIFISDKSSQNKIDTLKSLGAAVHICPSAVAHTHPESTYSQAATYAAQNPGHFYFNQYFNPDNTEAHYLSTGPEIWEQCQGNITHFIACAGTGGTISGVSKFLKEQDSDIQIWAVDAVGSIFTRYFETGEIDLSVKAPYTIEGVGKSFIPGNLNVNAIDRFIQVSDQEAIREARAFETKEGIAPGYSSGAVLAALSQIKSHLHDQSKVVALFADHGERYASTIYNDEWVEKLKQKQNGQAGN